MYTFFLMNYLNFTAGSTATSMTVLKWLLPQPACCSLCFNYANTRLCSKIVFHNTVFSVIRWDVALAIPSCRDDNYHAAIESGEKYLIAAVTGRKPRSSASICIEL